MKVNGRGMSMLEMLISLLVLAIAGTGALTGLTASARSLRTGPLRQVEMELIDAKIQRLSLMDRSSLQLNVPAAPAGIPMEQLPPGNLTPSASSPWRLDDPPGGPGDLSAGPYFTLLPNGQITPIPPGVQTGNILIAPSTPCGAPTLPSNVYCREVAVTQGLPPSSAASMASSLASSGAQAFTYWVRIIKGPAGPGWQQDPYLLVDREVFTQ